jgi:hypothetical protein
MDDDDDDDDAFVLIDALLFSADVVGKVPLLALLVGTLPGLLVSILPLLVLLDDVAGGGDGLLNLF